MIKRISFAMVLTVIIFISQPSYALYTWTDEAGQFHMSDKPKPTQEQQGNNLSSNEVTLSTAARNAHNSTGPNYGAIQPATTQTPYVNQSNNPIRQMQERLSQINMQQPYIYITPQAAGANNPPFDQMAVQRSIDRALTPLATVISGLLFLGLIHFIIFILTLIHIMKSEFKNSTNKILWVILILVLPLLGSVLYLFIGRFQRVVQDSADEELPRRRPRELDMQKSSRN